MFIFLEIKQATMYIMRETDINQNQHVHRIVLMPLLAILPLG